MLTTHAAAACLYVADWVIIHQVGKSKAQLWGSVWTTECHFWYFLGLLTISGLWWPKASLSRDFMTLLSMHLYFENSAEKLHPHETLSTPIKLLSSLSSSIRCHISLFNTHETLMKPHWDCPKHGRMLHILWLGCSTSTAVPLGWVFEIGLNKCKLDCYFFPFAGVSISVISQS
jgi:hypothetical protein